MVRGILVCGYIEPRNRFALLCCFRQVPVHRAAILQEMNFPGRLVQCPRLGFPSTGTSTGEARTTSHHLTPPYTTSHHLTSPHTTSHNLTPPHTTSNHLKTSHSTSHHMIPYYTPSNRLTPPYTTLHHLTPPYTTLHHPAPPYTIYI